MDFEWDRQKAKANQIKHGVDFAEAVSVFYDEWAVTLPDLIHEERFVTLGVDALNRILVVVYAWRADRIRIISARKASARERLDYRRKR